MTRKEEFFRNRSLSEKLCDARTLLNRRQDFRGLQLYEKLDASDFEDMKVILDDLRDQGLISEWVIGGGTAVMYYTDAIPSVDVDVFAYYPHTSALAPLSRVYECLITAYGAKIKEEMINVGGIYFQFLPSDSKNPVDAEAARHPNTVKGGLKIFGFEYLICSMLYVGSRKYISRLMTIKAEQSYDDKKLSELLKKFRLEKQWEAIPGEI